MRFDSRDMSSKALRDMSSKALADEGFLMAAGVI
jgi:hypothetical protein